MIARVLLLLWIGLLTGPSAVRATDTFYPEAQADLSAGKVWADTFFTKNSTLVTTAFRAHIPYEAADLWELFIDTNSYKHIHKDYTDSMSLTAEQFQSVLDQKPENVKAFYELIGKEPASSFEGRAVGKKWKSRVFQRFNFPFPLADRWNVMEAVNDETASKQGRYRYDYTNHAGNFRELRGYWELVPVEGKPGWTEFRGEYKVDPGIPVPKFLAKSIYKSSTRKSLDEKLAVMAERGKTKAK